MAYTTEARVRRRLGNITIGQLPSAQIEDAIASADAIIDSFLEARYEVPLTTTPALIQHISEELAIYYCATDITSKGAIGQSLEILDMRYTRALKLLDQIKNGKMSVPGLSGRGGTTRLIWSSTENNNSKIFDIDHETQWGVSSDLLDEIADERDTDETRLPE